ncbi:MAG: GFA family protein [Caulobacteraceae bacterium]
MLTGGCFCKSLRYEAGGEPFERALCHCSMCRGTTGAPAVAWFAVMRSEFRFTAGEPAAFASSAQAERTFCAHCGTQLTFAHKDYGDRIDITAASLDDPEAAAPVEHIWTRSRLSWMTDLDRLPEHTMQDRP